MQQRTDRWNCAQLSGKHRAVAMMIPARAFRAGHNPPVPSLSIRAVAILQVGPVTLEVGAGE